MGTISLHTEEPDVGDIQNTSEANYSGYARVTADEGVVIFPASASAAERLTHYAVGDGSVIASVHALSPEILVEIGSTPSFII